jgi:16S rRNA (cytosine1402-N4)-methyltransferase
VPNIIHKPVMVAEVLAALEPKPGQRFLDGTIGMGGHAAAILERSSPTGWLFGCDRDGEAITAARPRLAPYAGRFEIRQGNFTQVAEWVEAGSCDGALLDLGVSSLQLDQAERGFSFQTDGPLDMRMDRSHGLTAAQVLAENSPEDLGRIFWELGGERNARRAAHLIEAERRTRPIETTGQLARLMERLNPQRGQRIHPATKVFQALRMTVNDEQGSLKRGLSAVWSRLKPGGRLAVITFHSGEDRVMKEFGRAGARPYVLPDPNGPDIPELRQARAPELRIVTRKAITPGAAELADNPRCRSAQLRICEKIYGT